MDILFASSGIAKDFSNSKRLVQRFGDRRGRLIAQRLQEFRAADVLEDLRNLPGPRCHELKENRNGQLAVNLDHPYRLVFEPANEPIPRMPDGGLDWTTVTAVRIREVVDYHG